MRKQTLLLLMISIFIGLISVSYAAFSENMLIDGEAIVRAPADIRVTDLRVNNLSNSGFETYNSKYSKEATNTYVTLPNGNSSVTYDVTVTNKSSSTYYLKAINELTYDNSNVKYEIIGIDIHDLVNPNSTATFQIRLTNKTSSRQSVELSLNYIFEEYIVYTITYNLNGGTNPANAPTSYSNISNTITLPTPTRNGYTFNGWYTSSSYSGSSVASIPAGSTGNKIYYAKWQQTFVKYAVQIYGISQDVDANDQPLGLTFGPATGDDYNNSYVTHEYEETSSGSGVYNVKCVTYNVAQDGTATKDTSKTYTLTGTRTQTQKNLYDVNLHEMTWAQISALADPSLTATQSPFYDAMLCGDTKSVRLDLNSTIASGSLYNQWGDGAGSLFDTVVEYYKFWNPSSTQNSAATNGGSNGMNAMNAGGYRVSHIRATLVGSTPTVSYAGNVNLNTSNSLYSCIESDLQDVITAKKVKYVTGTSTSSNTLNTNIADKIWLFSERELSGTGEYSGDSKEGIGATGVAYDKFKNTESKHYIPYYTRGLSQYDLSECRMYYRENGEIINAALRSIGLHSGAMVTGVLTNGTISQGFPGSGRGLSFGFCLTK